MTARGACRAERLALARDDGEVQRQGVEGAAEEDRGRYEPEVERELQGADQHQGIGEREVEAQDRLEPEHVGHAVGDSQQSDSDDGGEHEPEAPPRGIGEAREERRVAQRRPDEEHGVRPAVGVVPDHPGRRLVEQKEGLVAVVGEGEQRERAGDRQGGAERPTDRGPRREARRPRASAHIVLK